MPCYAAAFQLAHVTGSSTWLQVEHSKEQQVEVRRDSVESPIAGRFKRSHTAGGHGCQNAAVLYGDVMLWYTGLPADMITRC